MREFKNKQQSNRNEWTNGCVKGTHTSVKVKCDCNKYFKCTFNNNFLLFYNFYNFFFLLCSRCCCSCFVVYARQIYRDKWVVLFGCDCVIESCDFSLLTHSNTMNYIVLPSNFSTLNMIMISFIILSDLFFFSFLFAVAAQALHDILNTRLWFKWDSVV